MLDEINDMTDYLRTYGNILTDKIKETAEPLFNPGDKWNEKMYSHALRIRVSSMQNPISPRIGKIHAVVTYLGLTGVYPDLGI